jgi:hypothetical protein
LRCNSKLDVVLVLDGSGSVGQATGWDATKKAAGLLVDRFNTGDDGAQISVFVYRGTTTWVD